MAFTTAVRPSRSIRSQDAGQHRAAILRNEAAPVGPADPAQAGRRRGDAPAPHEHDLNK